MSALETPVSYDFWCGVWILGSLVGRKMVINRPQAPVFLNPYLVLCADAGLTRKSTAVRLASQLFNRAGLADDCHLVTASDTVSNINMNLAQLNEEGHDANCRIVVSELVTLLGKEGHSMSLPGYLTDMYDCPRSTTYGRSGEGRTSTISNAHFTMLSASTPSWLVRAINPDVIEGGFTSRCLFIIEDKPKRLVAWPESSVDEALRIGTLSTQLGVIRTEVTKWSTSGITLTATALTKFKDWYASRSLESNDSFIQSFEAREDHHILRLAGILAVNDRSYVIDAFHIGHAIRIITDCKRRAAGIFGIQKSNKRLIAGIDKLKDVLIDGGAQGLTKTQLVFKTRTYLTRDELNFTIANMHELEMLQEFEIKTKGRNATIYRGTNKLLNRVLNESLLDRLRDS